MTHYSHHQRYPRDCRERIDRGGPCKNVAPWLVLLDGEHWEPVCSYHRRDHGYAKRFEMRHRP